MDAPKLPKGFVRAKWRGTLPLHPTSNERCVSFDLEDGTVIRLCLPYRDSIHVHETFAPGHDDQVREALRMMVQSDKSLLSPSEPKSVPSEGDQQ